MACRGGDGTQGDACAAVPLEPRQLLLRCSTTYLHVGAMALLATAYLY